MNVASIHVSRLFAAELCPTPNPNFDLICTTNKNRGQTLIVCLSSKIHLNRVQFLIQILDRVLTFCIKLIYFCECTNTYYTKIFFQNLFLYSKNRLSKSFIARFDEKELITELNVQLSSLWIKNKIHMCPHELSLICWTCLKLNRIFFTGFK